MSWKPFILIIFPVAAVIIAAMLIHLSTWFLWFLVPDGGLKIALNYTQPGTQIISELLLSSLVPEITTLNNNVRRFAYVQTSDSSIIALIPKNPLLFRERDLIKQQLSQDNWHIRNYGLIIIGIKGSSSINSTSFIFQETFRKLYSRQYPYQPVVIAVRPASTAGEHIPDLAALGVYYSQTREVKIVSADKLINLPRFTITSPPLPSIDDFLSFNLPGLTIRSIAAQYQSRWDDVLHKKFGFIQTKPEFTRLMSSQQTAGITISNGSASIAMVGDVKGLAATLSKWLSSEEAYTRPQSSAFKLPDGTLAYEIIPGDPQPVLSNPDNSGCQSPLHPEINIWLCQNQTGVSIGTTYNMAHQALSGISTDYNAVSISRQYLDQLDLPALNPIYSLGLYNSNPYTVLTVKLR